MCIDSPNTTESDFVALEATCVPSSLQYVVNKAENITPLITNVVNKVGNVIALIAKSVSLKRLITKSYLNQNLLCVEGLLKNLNNGSSNSQTWTYWITLPLWYCWNEVQDATYNFFQMFYVSIAGSFSVLCTFVLHSRRRHSFYLFCHITWRNHVLLPRFCSQQITSPAISLQF